MPEPKHIPKDLKRHGVREITTNLPANKTIVMSSFQCQVFVASFGDEILKRFKQKKAAQHG